MFELSYSLLDRLQRMQQEVEEISGWRDDIRSAPRGAFPAINIGNSADRIDVYLFAPGIDPGQLDIQVQHNVLTIAGKREASTAPVNGSGARGTTFHRRERFAGEFRRIVALPDDADPARIKATYRDGIVHVEVQRRESARPRRIEIH